MLFQTRSRSFLSNWYKTEKREKKYLKIFQHKFKTQWLEKNSEKKNIPKLERTKNQIIEKET